MSSNLGALLLAQQRHLIEQVMVNDEVAREFGLSVTELQLLHLLALRPEVTTAHQLSAVTRLPTSTLSNMLDRLERAGFVRRQRSTTDRRKLLIELTSQISQIQQRYTDSDMAARMHQALHGFTQEQVDVLLTYFQGLDSANDSQLPSN